MLPAEQIYQTVPAELAKTQTEGLVKIGQHPLQAGSLLTGCGTSEAGERLINMTYEPYEAGHSRLEIERFWAQSGPTFARDTWNCELWKSATWLLHSLASRPGHDQTASKGLAKDSTGHTRRRHS